MSDGQYKLGPVFTAHVNHAEEAGDGGLRLHLDIGCARGCEDSYVPADIRDRSVFRARVPDSGTYVEVQFITGGAADRWPRAGTGLIIGRVKLSCG